ncbi:MAG: TonB-dependent receptor [Bacteroidota bacterium]
MKVYDFLMYRYFLLFMILIFESTLFAGTTGKITGVIVDKETKESLVGANIMLEGTNIGAATDVDGRYLILNVSPRRYNLIISMMGYKKIKIEGIQVESDMTTEVNVELETTVIEGELVVIKGERPLIQKDKTGKASIINAELIAEAPIDDISQVLTMESNVVNIPTTVEGTNIGIPGMSDLGVPQVHIRGGRVSETQYTLDGMSISNPLYGELGLRMNKESVQEMQILAGSFNAEYGNAMSGMVNIVTKEGTDKWNINADYKTTKLGTKSDQLWNLHSLMGAISGPIFGGVTFFSTFRIKESADQVYEFDNIVYNSNSSNKTYSGYGKPRNVHPYDTKSSWQNFGYNNQKDFMAKLSIPFSSQIKLNLTGAGMIWDYKLYNFWYQYNMDSRNENVHKVLNLSALLNHVLSTNTYYTFGVSMLSKYRKQRVYRTIDGERVELIPAPINSEDVDSTLIDYYYKSPEPRDPFYSEFSVGDDEYWTDEYQTVYNMKFDITSQVSQKHLLKAGAELKLFDFDVNEQSQVHVGGSHNLNIYQKTPKQAAFYIQDKMEYDYLIVNAGLRLDYEKSEGSFWKDPTQWKSGEEKVKPHLNLAPRLGVSIPISVATVFHFNYGIFYQNASYANRFFQPNREQVMKQIWPMLGNPLLEPEETTAYEIGLKQMLSEDMFFEVNLWLKKTVNMVGTVFVPQFSDTTHTNTHYSVFDNLDYSSAQGIDFSLKKRYSNYISFEFNYSYGLATGIREDQFQGFRSFTSPATLPAKERILSWNQPHIIRFNLFVRFPRDMQSSILRDLRLSLLYSGNSGYPYTSTTIYGEQIGEVNAFQRPWMNNIDLRIVKTITFSSFSISPYLEVTNLLDIRNVVFFYPETGSAKDPGNLWGGTTTYRDRPIYYSPSRQIRLGISANFTQR